MDPVHAKAVQRRAVEAAIWGMPYVNYRMMVRAGESAGMTGPNQILYWSRLLDSQNQTLTPNPDVIYLMAFVDTTDGPVVLEIPPAEGGAINGSVMDAWQAAIEDVGPAGVDEGKGGTYLILPPGFDGEVPDGYVPMRSGTFEGYALLRSVPASGTDADVAAAIDYGRRIRLHPLATPDAETVFVDAAGQLVDSKIPWDATFYRELAEFVRREPWQERDRAMIDQLRTLGIVKGQPFDPDPETVSALEAGIADAREWFDAAYESLFVPFTDAGRWAVPAAVEAIKATGEGWTDPDAYPIDSRGLVYTYAFFSSRHLGHGQFYLMTIRDAAGEPFHGAHTYELTVSADAPVTQYWSATVYDRATHTFLSGVARTGRSSQSAGLVIDDDGSVTLAFSPTPPEDGEANWIPTVAGTDFEVLFRLYGPTPALFDKTWKLPDIHRID